MSERDVMLSGQPYKPWSKELQDDRDTARSLIERYNASMSSDKQLRSGIIAALFGSIDKEHPPHLEAPFYCDYVSPHFLHLETRQAAVLPFSMCSTHSSIIRLPGFQSVHTEVWYAGLQYFCRQGLLLVSAQPVPS